MPCVAPIVVTHPETKLRSEVRCGQCRVCRLRRKLAWVGRLTLESKEHIASRFLTLTYAEDPGILDYRDFQLFMKSYREVYGACRFFCVGEYGGKSGRGHYHAIIFGQSPESRGFAHRVSEVWGRGYCFDGTVTPHSIGYVAGYVFKENYSADKLPFVRMSLRPGVGMAGIRRLAAVSAATGIVLSRWPVSYSFGGRAFPLCDGGLAAWQTAYLESGGLPPPISNPLVRDLQARARSHDRFGRGGAQLSDESKRSYNLHRRYEDASALKKDR